MVPSELTRRVGYGGVIILLDCWKWGPYGVPDQQGDTCARIEEMNSLREVIAAMAVPSQKSPE